MPPQTHAVARHVQRIEVAPVVVVVQLGVGVNVTLAWSFVCLAESVRDLLSVRRHATFANVSRAFVAFGCVSWGVLGYGVVASDASSGILTRRIWRNQVERRL